MRRAIVAVVTTWLWAATAGAQTQILLDEVVGSWLGDDGVQYVTLGMLDGGQGGLANTGVLVFDDASASAAGRRFYTFPANVAQSGPGVRVLVATSAAAAQANVTPDFVLPAGMLQPRAGRVCYGVTSASGIMPIDCVAYGAFAGNNGSFGAPVRLPPYNLVLRHSARTGKNRADWTTALDPVLINDAGAHGTLFATQCGDGRISQGEACDGDALGGATCASIGFAKGTLACAQCQYDTRGCTTCGDGAIQGKEECDGDDLGGRTCTSIGYTGGTLACTEDCHVTTAPCDGAFYVPGGGAAKADCLGEWKLTSRTDGPTVAGALPKRERCADGDPACDADGAANGTCVFSVSVCFGHIEPRLQTCRLAAVSAWSLLGKLDPATAPASTLVAAVAALGPSTVDGLAVSFSPALAEADACTTPVPIDVPVRHRVVLRSRALGPQKGKPRDVDVLRLACAP